ncbi:hypothetical protein [uncultured Allobaculum sp.]|uniref:hypothetical protein n=1 Tax=uncultured Allobaculum sp. TaxID=1187017 RepID=UPI00261E71F3|nr:hypothetical protein [uncultured Allobaculum sp.]
MRRVCIDKNGNMYAVINRAKRGWKVHVWKNDSDNHHWDYFNMEQAQTEKRPLL